MKSYRHVAVSVHGARSTLGLLVLAHAGEGGPPEDRPPEAPEAPEPLLAPGLVNVIGADSGINNLLRLFLNLLLL